MKEAALGECKCFAFIGFFCSGMLLQLVIPKPTEGGRGTPFNLAVS